MFNSRLLIASYGLNGLGGVLNGTGLSGFNPLSPIGGNKDSLMIIGFMVLLIMLLK